MRRFFVGLLVFCGAAHAQVRITQPAQLGASVVTTPAIANGSVTAEKLAAGVGSGVTSVNVSTAVAGLSFSGGPITGTGSITFGVTDSALFRAAIGANEAGNLTTGTVAPARLGTGTPSTSTYLRGDGAWTAPPYLTSASPLDATKLTGTASVNTTGTAAGLSSTLGITGGGTGATSTSAARTALGLAIGTDVLAPTGSGTGLSGVAKLSGGNTFTGTQSVTGGVTASVISTPYATITGGTINGTLTHLSSEAQLDPGMTGMFDHNDLANVGLWGNVTCTLEETGQSNQTGTTGNQAFDGFAGSYMAFVATDISKVTKLTIWGDTGQTMPNYALAKWQPYLLYRLTGIASIFKTITVEVSSDNVNWQTAAANGWTCADITSSPTFPGFWIGSTVTPTVPTTQTSWRYFRFTLTNIQFNSGYAFKNQIWLSELGIRAPTAPWSKYYLPTAGGNVLGGVNVNGSVGIGTTSPSSKAALDVTSTTQGVLFPRMTTTQKNAITSPTEGLMVYDTVLHALCLYNGTAWVTVTAS